MAGRQAFFPSFFFLAMRHGDVPAISCKLIAHFFSDLSGSVCSGLMKMAYHLAIYGYSGCRSGGELWLGLVSRVLWTSEAC